MMELSPEQFKVLREMLRDHFESDMSVGSHYHSYVANIAMLLHDQYGITDLTERNDAAIQIMCLVFGVGEAREVK